MAKLYFRFGTGKTTDICQVAYNYYNERKMNIVIINAYNNEEIKSKVIVDGEVLLSCKPNIMLSSDSLYQTLYDKISSDNVKAILVDNSEYLTATEAEDLFYITKILDVPVIAYGNRLMRDGSSSLGVQRLMALADKIERIDKCMGRKRANFDYIYGAMNCSKSAQLLTKNQSLINEGYKTCLIKPKLDRSELYITSRIGLRKKASIILDREDSIYGQAEYMAIDRINYILVDEIQFLTKSQIEQLRRIVNDYNIQVIGYGLKTDFLSNLFPGSETCLELADNIYKMKTVCSCGRGANFNVRRDKLGNYITSGEQICIDDGDNYDSECAYCFMEHVLNIDTKVKSRVKKRDS